MESTYQPSAIEKVIFAYGEAFNAADIQKIVSSYISEGILMPNSAPASKGTDQLTASFKSLFDAFQITIRYIIEEIIVSGQYGYLRTNSKVNTLVKANGDRILLENKELFVLYNADGNWKISHYIFNNTKTNK